MQRVPMTPAGHAALTAELKHLKEVVRFQIVRDIEEARAHGDISENSEFEDAKHRQALTEGRIRELEGKLSASEINDITRIPCVECDPHQCTSIRIIFHSCRRINGSC